MLAKAIISQYCGCIADYNAVLPHARQLSVLEGVGLSAWVEVDGNWKFVQVGNITIVLTLAFTLRYP